MITLNDLKKSVSKKYQIGSSEDYQVISSGSIDLDIATGIGGFPLGRIVETYAQESAGKTFIAMKTAANALKVDPRAVAYIDSEFAMDKTWAKLNGLDMEDERVLFYQPDTVENACNLIIDLVKSGLVSVVVLDSISSLVPQKELEGEVGDSTIGLKARLLGQFLRIIRGELLRNNVLLLTVGQLRDSIGGISFGDTATTDYGNAMKFYASMRVRYWKGIEKDSSGQPIANRTTAKIEKNKCATPFGKASFDIVYGEGIDSDKELINIAIREEVLPKAASWITLPDGSKTQGINGVKEAMLEQPQLRIDLINKINEKFRGKGITARIPLPAQPVEMGQL